MKATFEWLMAQKYNSPQDASRFGKMFSMPDIGDNELTIFALRSRGHGFKEIARRIKKEPMVVYGWMKKAGLISPVDRFRVAPVLIERRQAKRRNKEFEKAYRGMWADEWKGVVEDYQGEYFKIINERERCRIKAKETWLKRRTEAVWRLKRYARTRVSRALKDQYIAKNKKTHTLIGCDWEFLSKYIEAQFQDGMNWENYGHWHVDHIVPCCLFDLSDESQLKKCFHYTNLRPLWAQDNWSRPKDGSDLPSLPPPTLKKVIKH